MAEQPALPDYSEWLTAERHALESEHWAEDKLYLRYAGQLKALCVAKHLWSILELGCGDGWIPTQLDERYDWTGVERNPFAIREARTRNPDYDIHDMDIREVTPARLEVWTGQRDVDIVCAFAVLKHFGLHEWKEVLAGMLKLGLYAVFSMPVGGQEQDNGTEFHHAWVSEETLMAGIELGGHRLISQEPFGDDPHVADSLGREIILFTERRLNDESA